MILCSAAHSSALHINNLTLTPLMTRLLIYILFFGWLLATTAILLTPAENVRQSSSAIKRQSVVKAHKQSFAFKRVNDGNNWHLFFFFGLSTLTALLPGKRAVKTYAKRGLLLFVFSLFMELIQEFFIPGRSFELLDLGLNAIGISAGMTVGMLIDAGIARFRGKRHC